MTSLIIILMLYMVNSRCEEDVNFCLDFHEEKDTLE